MADQEHTFLEKFSLPLSTLWEQYRVFLIIFGLLVLTWKFREVIIDLLVTSSRKTVSDAQKQDTTLKNEEKQINDQANILRKEAEDLSKNKPNVDEDWNKK